MGLCCTAEVNANKIRSDTNIVAYDLSKNEAAKP